MATLSLQYIAGFFDGEGYVGIHTLKEKYFHVRVIIVNTNLKILQMIQDQFGGTIIQRKRVRNNKPTYALSFSGSFAKIFLKSILPFLIEKRGQTIIALQLADSLHIGEKNLTHDIITQRHTLKLQLQALKHEEVSTSPLMLV